MKQRWRLIVLMFMTSCVWGHAQLTSLYKQLDDAISHTQEYVAAKEHSIQRLVGKLSLTQDSREKYYLCKSIFEEYRSYKSDSALAYVSRCLHLAQEMKDQSLTDACRVAMAYQCSSTGLSVEALDFVGSLSHVPTSPERLAEYDKAYSHVYGELAFYCKVPSLKQEYYRRQDAYDDLLFKNASPQFDYCLQRKEQRAMKAKDLKAALHYNDMRMRGLKDTDRDFAIVAFYRADDYGKMNKKEERQYWMLKAAICDIKNAVMDQGAMWEVANILREQGDMERSHRYIQFAWNCSQIYTTRLRSWQISPILSSVNENYQLQLNKRNNQLRSGIMAIGVLVVLLLATIFYINRQRKKLSEARDQLHRSNQQLSELNANLTTANAELHSLNTELSQANRMKEEYVGRFMRLCSQYIDRQNDFRKLVHRKVKNHEYQQLFEETKSQDDQEKELVELYENFDSAFLHLFPHFVEDFNALLRPEERIPLDKAKGLPTQIRIFALIRLGIEDSAKIAEFLHYSVNTIYSYRARVKNGAKENRDEFESQVKRIGMS